METRHMDVIGRGMRIVIQDRKRKLFFNQGKGWVVSMEEATDFPTPFTAFQFGLQQRLGDTEVVFLPAPCPIASESGETPI